MKTLESRNQIDEYQKKELSKIQNVINDFNYIRKGLINQTRDATNFDEIDSLVIEIKNVDFSILTEQKLINIEKEIDGTDAKIINIVDCKIDSIFQVPFFLRAKDPEIEISSKQMKFMFDEKKINLEFSEPSFQLSSLKEFLNESRELGIPLSSLKEFLNENRELGIPHDFMIENLERMMDPKIMVNSDFQKMVSNLPSKDDRKYKQELEVLFAKSAYGNVMIGKERCLLGRDVSSNIVSFLDRKDRKNLGNSINPQKSN